MKRLVMTLVDGSSYSKTFASQDLARSFLAKLEVLEGLFFEVITDSRKVNINPKFIVKVEEEDITHFTY